MRLKSDINLLKAAGNKQKIKSSAPVRLIVIAIVVAVIGFFGYTYYSQSQKINDLNTTIATSKRTINSNEKKAIADQNTATNQTTKSIEDAIATADKLGDYFDTIPAMFPHLSTKHETELRTIVMRAENSTLDSIEYTRATAILTVRSPNPNMETDVIDQLLAGHLFRKVGYRCPVCGKATYYSTTPAYVDCAYPEAHDDLPDVETKANDDGTYSTVYVCALKNIVDVCIEAPVLNSSEVTVTKKPQYSENTITIEASSTNREYLKNYWNAIKQSGYFSALSTFNPAETAGVWSITINCTVPEVKSTK